MQCVDPTCTLPARYRYPGNDPENGPAIPRCAAGHYPCELCQKPMQSEHESNICDDCEWLRCSGCGEPLFSECPLADRTGSALCFACEGLSEFARHVAGSCACDRCKNERVERARRFRTGEWTRDAYLHGCYEDDLSPFDGEEMNHPLGKLKFTDEPTVPYMTYRHHVGAPGIGYREYMALDTNGVGVLIEDTVREMEPWEAR